MAVRKKGPVETAVLFSVKWGELTNKDRATAAMARALAQEIDSGSCDIVKAGQLLLTYFEALLMTPRSRAQVLKEVKTDDKPATLDELAERRAWQSRAENLDASAT